MNPDSDKLEEVTFLSFLSKALQIIAAIIELLVLVLITFIGLFLVCTLFVFYRNELTFTNPELEFQPS